MSSEAQINASRLNGQLSHGPITEAGKSICSKNAVKFALTGATFLAPHDRLEDFENIEAAVTRQYNPATEPEKRIIREVAITTWRLAKIPFAESAILARGRKETAALFTDIKDPHHRALVCEGDILHRYSTSLTNLTLQQSRLQRNLERNVAEFKELRKERETVQTAPINRAMKSIWGENASPEATVGSVFSIPFLCDRIEFVTFNKTADVTLFDRSWPDKKAQART
jgi:hypothetical protein